jgi:hypothetical protein
MQVSCPDSFISSGYSIGGLVGPRAGPDAAVEKGKAIPVTGRGGPYGCETSRQTID